MKYKFIINRIGFIENIEFGNRSILRLSALGFTIIAALPRKSEEYVLGTPSLNILTYNSISTNNPSEKTPNQRACPQTHYLIGFQNILYLQNLLLHNSLGGEWTSSTSKTIYFCTAHLHSSCNIFMSSKCTLQMHLWI